MRGFVPSVRDQEKRKKHSCSISQALVNVTLNAIMIKQPRDVLGNRNRTVRCDQSCNTNGTWQARPISLLRAQISVAAAIQLCAELVFSCACQVTELLNHKTHMYMFACNDLHVSQHMLANSTVQTFLTTVGKTPTRYKHSSKGLSTRASETA